MSPKRWWPPCALPTNYSALSGRLRAHLGRLLTADDLADLGTMSPDLFRTTLAEGPYGLTLRRSHWMQGLPSLEQAVLAEVGHRLDRLFSFAQGEAAFCGLVLSLLSHIPAGLRVLLLHCGGAPRHQEPCFGPLPLEWWRRCEALDDFDLFDFLAREGHPVALALHRGLLALSKGALAQAERDYLDALLQVGWLWAREVKGGEVLGVLLEGLADQWNFRLWRHRLRHGSGPDYLSCFGSLKVEALESARAERKLFAGTPWRFERDEQKRDTAHDMAIQLLERLSRAGRADPLGQGLMISTFAKTLLEGEGLRRLSWLMGREENR